MSDAVNVRDERRREFFIVDNAVILQHGRTIGPYGIAVYNALAMHAGRDGRCNPSVLTIANEIGASKRAVQGAIATLTEAGLLDVEVQPAGPASTNAYILNSVSAPGACGAPPPGALSAPGACGAPEQEETIPPFAYAQGGSAAPAAPAEPPRKPNRAPTSQQELFGAICEVRRVDPDLLGDVDAANTGKLASKLVGLGVTPDVVRAAWAAEHERIEGFADGRPISPPTLARLKTIVGSFRLSRAPAPPADTRPPIGAVLAPLGLSMSNPARWPQHILDAYPDVAAQWGYVKVADEATR